MKTIPFLLKLDLSLLGCTGHIVMAVQNYLCAKGMVTTHLDRDMTPFRIPDMKRIMIHKWHRLLAPDTAKLASVGSLRFPYRHSCFAYQDQKQPRCPVVISQIRVGNLELLILGVAIYQHYSFRLGIRAHTAAKPPCHSHQEIGVQSIVRPKQGTPPCDHSPGLLSQRIICVQYDSIHAIVAVLDQILVVLRELVHRKDPLGIYSTTIRAAPQGPLFLSAVSEKACTTKLLNL